MVFADWHVFEDGLADAGTSAFGPRLNTTSPMVGTGSMEFHAVGITHGSDIHGDVYGSFFAYTNLMIAPTYKPRGVMRTLVQCRSASGLSTDPLSAGLNVLNGARLPANLGLAGSYGLMLNSSMADTSWQRLILAVYNRPYALPYAPIILMEYPLASVSHSTIVALELTFWHWPLDDFGGVRLIGKMGFATNYSDLVQIFEYSNIDYPTLAQSTGSGLYHGIACQFEGSVDMDFDETEFDEIITDPFRSR